MNYGKAQIDFMNENAKLKNEIERLNKGLEYMELYWSNREEYERTRFERIFRNIRRW